MTMLPRSAGLDRCLSTRAFMVFNTPPDNQGGDLRDSVSPLHTRARVHRSFLLYVTAAELYLVTEL